MIQTAEHQTDIDWMSEAIQLALQGQGSVEPNPMVGCVIVQPTNGSGRLLGKGFHERYGEPHAEVNALRAAGGKAKGATVYVTLEPCSHSGKTPPCVDALIEAQVARVVIGSTDPFELVKGRSLERLADAGILVTTGVGNKQATELIRPFEKRLQQDLPWIIGKWAMSLDGKMATVAGDSQWISNESSREIVHQLRGRVDAIMIGSGTAERDDPLLTARPPGPRTATRIVLDSTAKTSVDCKLIKSIDDAPLIVAVGPRADAQRCKMLGNLGCEIWRGNSLNSGERLMNLLHELAHRQMTNVLVEGGGQLLGSLSRLGQIDEVHAFIGPKILGGTNALSPVGGDGFELLANTQPFETNSVLEVDGDVYVVARRTCRLG